MNENQENQPDALSQGVEEAEVQPSDEAQPLNKVRYIAGAMVLAVVVAGIVWLSGDQEKSEPLYTGPVESVTLGVETSLLTAAVWVAEGEGYFQKYGIDVRIEEFESGKASFIDMLAGGVDVSTVAPTPIMFNSFKRQDFSIFATFVSSDDDVKVIARRSSGIAQATDLKGKKIGIVDGSTSQFFLSAFLTARGMSNSDVETVDLGPSSLPDALDSGEVDAIVIWEPHAYNAGQLLAENGLRIPGSDVYRETFNFMVMNDFAQSNPEALKRFLRAIDRATDFIEDNKSESQALVAERLDLDLEAMTVLWDDFTFEMSLSQSLILTLEDEARWAISNDLIEATRIPNYLDFIYADSLQSVKPAAVTIIE